MDASVFPGRRKSTICFTIWPTIWQTIWLTGFVAVLDHLAHHLDHYPPTVLDQFVGQAGGGQRFPPKAPTIWLCMFPRISGRSESFWYYILLMPADPQIEQN